MARAGYALPVPDQSLATNLAGISLATPVLLAAGTAGTLDEMADCVDLREVGGIVTKSITVEPRDGNQTWRILPTKAGMLNAIGLANVGVDAFVRDYGPRVAAVPTRVIGSVSEFSVDGFVRVCAAMNEIPGIQGVELNVSCPNVKHGCEFGSDEALLSELVRAVRAVLPRVRLFVKLSPVVVGRPGVVAMARAAIEPAGSQPSGPNQRPGADGLCISNTMPAMAIDVWTKKPKLARGSGGLSGPAIHPIAVKLVHDAYKGICKETSTPIVGIGGVVAWEDAAEFVLAGATAVEIGTGLFADPRSPVKVASGLAKWAKRMGVSRVSELVGGVLPPEQASA